MFMKHEMLRKQGLIALVVPVAALLLVGCGSGNETPKGDDATSTHIPGGGASKNAKEADEAVLLQFEQENTPRMVTFPDPGKAEPADYLDTNQPMTAFNLYNAKRDWAETPDDIGDSMADAFNLRKANPELYRLASQRQSESDSFKKKDLTTALGSLVAEEADKTKSKNLVKLSSDDWTPISLSSYDQQAKGFRLDNCLFSDKLDYTEEEKRNATSLARAPKLRCFLNPGPTSYYIGFQGGSEILLNVADESLARQIESSRESIGIDVYGFVKSVERERFAGEFGPQRFVLIAPQRVDLKDRTTGKIIYTKNI